MSTKSIGISLILALRLCAGAADFTGPAEWRLVHTNAAARWQAQQKERAGENFLVLNGVAADKGSGEVRLLAEAVGHGAGTTAEFLLVGPASDRAYESAAVTVASPSDIVRAVEFTGVRRGRCVDGTRFHFVPCGERFRLFVRRLDEQDSVERPFRDLLRESTPDDPLLDDRGFAFAGGVWQEQDGAKVCLADMVPPCSVVSLYNELSIFDLPRQAGQSAVYGRLTLKEALPYGTLLEVIVRPVSRESLVLPLRVTALTEAGQLRLRVQNEARGIDRRGTLQDTVLWLKSQADAGSDLYLAAGFDDGLTVAQARDAASVFEVMALTGIHLYGKADDSVYYKAFLPQDEWRRREGRMPQPFELHLSRGERDALQKKLVFIEEDWNVEGLEPRLTPREFSFGEWHELLPLVVESGGRESRIRVLFVFAPAGMPIGEFMPGVRALNERLPLVHIFAGEWEERHSDR